MKVFVRLDAIRIMIRESIDLPCEDYTGCNTATIQFTVPRATMH